MSLIVKVHRPNPAAAGQKRRTGRPPLTDDPDFLPRLYGVLPVLVAGDITVAEAAKRVRCSRRSLRRYRDETSFMWAAT